MADIKLQRPVEGQSISITPNGDDRLVFEFDSTEATLTREGDNLVMTFDEGTVLTLADFYVAYTSENMPEFVIGEEIVPGEAFFAALGEDLMPAAGSEGSTPQGGGTTVGFTDGSLFDSAVESLSGNAGPGLVVGTDPSTLGSFASDDGTLIAAEDDAGAGGGFGPINAAPVIEGATYNKDIVEKGVGTKFGPNDVAKGNAVMKGEILATDEGVVSFSLDGDATGKFGTITLNEDGTFSYKLNNKADATKALSEGPNGVNGVETFTVVATDEQGLQSSFEVVIRIQGTNDRPKMDFELPETNSFAITKKGNVTFEVDQEESASFTVIGSDVDAGDTFEFFLSTKATRQELEDGGRKGNDAFLDEAIKNGDLDSSIDGDYGTLSLGEDGKVTFTPNEAAKALAEGQDVDEVFSIYVKDAAGAWRVENVRVTVNGTNDAPELSIEYDGKKKVWEDGKNQDVAGSIVVNDVDSDGNVQTFSVELNGKTYTADSNGDIVVDGEYGQLTLNVHSREFSYVLDNDAAQVLGKGDTYKESFKVITTDAHGATDSDSLVVKVKGTNDAPEISTWHDGNHLWNHVGMYGETDANGYKNLVATGDLLAGVERNGVVKDQATDVDGDELFFAVGAVGADNKAPDTLSDDITFATPENASTIQGTYGVLTMNADGKYSYSVEGNEAYAALDGSEGQKNEFFTVYVKDEHGAWTAEEIKISLMGQNDAPVITLDEDSFNLKELGVKDRGDGPNSLHSGDALTKGSFTISDVDGDATHLITADNDVIVTDMPYYVVSDGNGGYKIVTEDKLGDDYVGTIIFKNGTDGKFDFAFNLNNDSTEINALDGGDKLSLDISLNASDGSDKLGSVTLPFNVAGTNDRPSLSFVGGATDGALKVHQVSEDASPEQLGQMKASDVDADDIGNLTFLIASGHITHFAKGEVPDTAVEVTPEKAATISSEYGIFSMKANGSYTFTPNEHAQSLGEGDSATAQFTIYVKDPAGAWTAKNVEVQIQGSNDAPVVTSTDDHTHTVVEAGVGVEHKGETFENMFNIGDPLAFGKITATDVDGDELSYGLEGGVSVEKTIEVAGKELTFDFSFDSADGEGVLFLDAASGNYAFVLNNDNAAIQALDAGDTKDITFTIQVKDGHTVVPQEVTITVTGSNDQPTLTVDSPTLNIVEGEVNSLSGKAIGNDVDASAELSYSVGYARPELADFTALFEGANAEIMAKLGDVTAEVFKTFAALPTEGTTVYGLYGKMVIDNDSDSETFGQYTYSLYTQEEAKELGTVTELAYWALQMRDDNDAALPTENFTVYVKDEHGAWNAENVTVNVKGSNDAPEIITATESLSVTEAGHGVEIDKNTLENVPHPGQAFAVGQMVAVDVDVEPLSFGIKGDTEQSGKLEVKDLVGDHDLLGELADADVFSYDSFLTNEYGTLYMNATTGTYIFVLDNTADATQALNGDDSALAKFTVEVSDGTATTSKEITINITGTNDKPELTVTANEDSELNAEGHHVITENTGNTPNSVGGTFVGKDVDKGETETLEYSVNITRPELGNETLKALAEAFLDAKNVSADSPLYDIVNSEIFGKIYNALGDGTDTPILDKISNLDGIKYGETEVDANGNPVEVYGLYGKMVIDPANGTYTYTLYTWDEAKDNVDTMLAYVALQRRDEDDALPTENFTIAVKDENGAWDYQNITVEVKGYDDGPKVLDDQDNDITHIPVELEISEHGVGVNDTASLTGVIFANIETSIKAAVVDAIPFDGGEALYDAVLQESISDILASLTPEQGAEINFPNMSTGTGDKAIDGKLNASDDDGAIIFTPSNADGDKGTLGIVAPSLDSIINSGIFEGDSLTDIGGKLEDVLSLVTESIEVLGKLPELFSGNFDAASLQEVLDSIPDFSVVSDLVSGGINTEGLLGLLKECVTLTVDGEYGHFVVKQNGSYEYVLDESKSNTLAEGDEATESFTITMTDIYGNQSTQEVNVTVEGKNDAPIITVADNLVVSENTLVSETLTAKGEDIDSGATLNYYAGPSLVTLMDDIGEAMVQESINSIIEALKAKAEGATGVDALAWNAAIGVVEGLMGQDGAIEMDALLGILMGDISKGGALPGVDENGKDIDSTDNFGAESAGKYGTLTIDPASGKYSFKHMEEPQYPGDNASEAELKAYNEAKANYDAVQSLAEGQSLSENYTIYVVDEHGAWTSKEITVTINGENDEPVYEEKARLDAVEDSTVPAKGSVGATDTDAGQNVFTYTEQEVEDPYGTFIVNADGTYSFTVNNNAEGVQDLAAGQTWSKEFTVTGTNSNNEVVTQTVTVVITGTNDAPALNFETLEHTTHDDAFDTNPATQGPNSVKSASGTFVVTEGEGVNTVTVAFGNESVSFETGTSFENGTQKITTENGTFTITAYDAASGKVSYTYEQTAPADHSNGPVVEEFTVTVSDTDNGTADDATGTIKVTIENDVETINLETIESFELKDENHATDVDGSLDLTANLAGNDVTAIYVGTTKVDLTVEGGTSIQGSHGTLLVTYDAATQTVNYTYDQTGAASNENGADALEEFKLSIERADGASIEGTINVSIADDGPINVRVDAMPTHSDTTEYTGSISADFGADGKGAKFNINGQDVVVNEATTVAGLGTILIDSYGEYTLTNPVGTGSVSMEVKVYDADGSLSEGSTVSIDINTVSGYTAEYEKLTPTETTLPWYLGGGTVYSGKTVEGDSGENAVLIKGMDTENRASVAHRVDLKEGDDMLHINGKIEGKATILGVEANSNTLTGGDGIDTLKLENLTTDDTYTFTGLNTAFTVSGADANFVSFEKFEFGNSNDTVDFSSFGAANAYTGAGDDTVTGSLFADTLDGGAGNDSINGGVGDDAIYGGAGNDTLTGDFGADSLFGGDGDDIIFGDLNDLVIKGGNGNDLIILPNIDDVLEMDIDGGQGIDILLAGLDSKAEHTDVLNSSVKNIDILMYGDETAAKELHADLANAKDGDNISQELKDGKWEATEMDDYVSSNGITYREFTSTEDDKLTILVNTNLLGNNQG